jgi:hypothetical protein
MRVNKNLCHFPLARDARLRFSWRRLKSGAWFCDLSDDERDPRIRLVLPADAGEELRRAPTGFDTLVLFTLLAEVQLTGLGRLRFRDRAQLLRGAGLYPNARNRRRLRDALAYWSAVRTRFERWYVAREGHEVRRMPPPVRCARRRGRALVVEIDGAWVSTALEKAYFARVPLHLLTSAAADQNFLLWVLATPLVPVNLRSPGDDADEWVNMTRPLSARRLCRKLGISHRHRNRTLAGAVARVGRLLRTGGGDVWCCMTNDARAATGRVRFLVKLPKIKTVRNSGGGVRRNGPQRTHKRSATERETVRNSGGTL